MLWRTRSIGNPVILDHEEMKRVLERYKSYGQNTQEPETSLDKSLALELEADLLCAFARRANTVVQMKWPRKVFCRQVVFVGILCLKYAFKRSRNGAAAPRWGS